MSPLFSHDRPWNRQIAKQERSQFESLAITAAHGDTAALQALPAAATQAREYYRNDKKYLDEAWAVMTVALRDVLTDDVLTEQKETDIAKLSFALGIQQWGVDLAHRNFAMFEEVMVHGSTTDVPYPTTARPSWRNQGRPRFTQPSRLP